jgi:hypothetical protein
MALSLTQTSLVRIVAGQAITNNLLRWLALSPSVSISGSVATADLADGAVTPAKITPGGYFYAADTTSTNTYTATFTPAVGAYADGLQVFLKITNANTAAAPPSLNANALGAKNIYHRHGQTPKAGDLPANSILHLVYNSSLNAGAGGFEIYGVTPSATIRPAANVTTGTVNAQSVVNAPPLTAYAAGVLLLVTAGTGLTNTGAMTLNCDGLGTRNIKRPGGETLLAGDFQAGYTHLLYDDGTQFILLTRDRPQGIVASGRNIVIANNASSPATQIDVSAEEVLLKHSGNGMPLLVSAVSLTLDIALGVALNGFETGASRTTNRWYYLWLISDGTNVRGVLEDSGSADGALPGGPDLSNAAFTGYVYYGLVGQIRLNATGLGEVVRFWQHDRSVAIERTNIFSAFALSSTWAVLGGTQLTNFRSAVPPNGRWAKGNFGATVTSAAIGIAACKDDGTADTTNIIGQQISVGDVAGVTIDSFAGGCNFKVPVRGGAARNVQVISDSGTAKNRLSITGYTF